MTRVEVAGGFALNAEVSGACDPLVLLHGFTGSAAGWGDFGRALARDFTTIAIDIVGHGASDKPEEIEHYLMERAAEDLVETVRRLGFERAAWLGYSMGARTALHVAAAFPRAVSSLVLIGGSAGIDCVEDRIARHSADDLLAARIEREGVPAFVDYWEALPLFATQAAMPPEARAALRAGRLANAAVGLAGSLRGMGAGAQEPLHHELLKIDVPVLVLAGALDRKYVEIGTAMAAALPDGRFDTIPAAGHAAQLEQPRTTAERVSSFLAELPLRAPHGVSP